MVVGFVVSLDVVGFCVLDLMLWAWMDPMVMMRGHLMRLQLMVGHHMYLNK